MANCKIDHSLNLWQACQLSPDLHWKKLAILGLIALLTTGCRLPFSSLRNSEPSFDQLLELEQPSTYSPTAQQVQQRRPGSSGRSPASRYSTGDEEHNQQVSQQLTGRNRSGNRRISDQEFQDKTNRSHHGYQPEPQPIEDELSLSSDELESDFNQNELSIDPSSALMRRTELALKSSAEQAPLPSMKKDVSRARSSRQPPPAEELDDHVVIRLHDNEDTNASDASPKSPTPSAATTSLARQNALQPASTESSQQHHRRVNDSQIANASYEKSDVQPQGLDDALQLSTADTAVSLTWQEHLRQAMQQLQKTSADSTITPQQRMRNQVISRLLALSLADRELMLQTLEGLQPHEQDYFSHQLTALFDAIDPDANPAHSRKWSLVMLNQRKAHQNLASLSNLEIRNMAFCTEVMDFGVVAPFDKYRFSSDQELLLYLELDNFVCEKTSDGKAYETHLQGSYEIIDSSGRRVADQTLPADSHRCKNVRHDYFIAYRIYLPAKIPTGSYTLKLTIEDLKGHKFGQSDIQFQIQ